MSDLERRAALLIQETELIGYIRGMGEGASRLQTLSSVVPSSVTKAWIKEEAGRYAKVLDAKVDQSLAEIKVIQSRAGSE